jgi:hypothetical protein
MKPLSERIVSAPEDRRPVPRGAFSAALRGLGIGIVAGEFPVGQTLPG